jgi:hypothetical protein
MHANVWWGNVKERDSMENLCVDGRVRVELVLKIWNSWKWAGFICPQDKWRAVMEKVMNIRVQ